MASAFRVYIATSNAGKLRDFKGAASPLGITVVPLSGFENIPLAIEDADTFEQNARIKAEHYSRYAPGELVLADDSGLAVDALNGAPGVHSARYAAIINGDSTHQNSDDQENNRVTVFCASARPTMCTSLEPIPATARSGKFVCVIAAAKDGVTVKTFSGEAEGDLLTTPRGSNGFGYDPLFYFPALGHTFAELTPEEKTKYSHRGKAFRKFLEWYKTSP